MRCKWGCAVFKWECAVTGKWLPLRCDIHHTTRDAASAGALLSAVDRPGPQVTTSRLNSQSKSHGGRRHGTVWSLTVVCVREGDRPLQQDDVVAAPRVLRVPACQGPARPLPVSTPVPLFRPPARCEYSSTPSSARPPAPSIACAPLPIECANHAPAAAQPTRRPTVTYPLR